MFDMMKPMLLAMLGQTATAMAAKSKDLHATAEYADGGGQKDLALNLFIRAGLWGDAADMIRKSIGQ